MQDWLEGSESYGLLHSRGRFTIDTTSAQTLAGLPALEMHDVPLLLLAGAVEGGSRYFRIHGSENVRLSWEGSPGPSSELARSLLAAARVDFDWEEQRGLELPPVFADYLSPLAERGRHAPLKLVWGDRLIAQGSEGSRLLVSRCRGSGRLTLVDRGIDFPFPAAFAGLDILAWVEPLPGAPWPRQLLWGPRLAHQLGRIAQALSGL